MAAPVNTFTSTDQVGIREDLSDIISNIAPFETPWYSAIKKVKASNTLHEWQTDDLAAPSDANAQLEGDDTVAELSSPTTRLNNQCQIFKKSAAISGTDTGLNKAGRAKEMAYQLQKRTREMKTDMESSMFANKAKVARSGATTAGVMAGVGAWLTTNVNNVGVGGSNPVGDGTDARVDGTPTVFAQTDFDTTMQEIWEEGGMPEVVYLNAARLQTAIDSFTGMNNQRSYLEASKTGQNMIVNAVDVYVTPWGRVEFVPSRHVRPTDVVIIQKDKWAFANLRPVKNEPLAKTGDSEKRQIIAEGTLICYNEKANGLVADASVA